MWLWRRGYRERSVVVVVALSSCLYSIRVHYLVCLLLSDNERNSGVERFPLFGHEEMDRHHAGFVDMENPQQVLARTSMSNGNFWVADE